MKKQLLLCALLVGVNLFGSDKKAATISALISQEMGLIFQDGKRVTDDYVAQCKHSDSNEKCQNLFETIKNNYFENTLKPRLATLLTTVQKCENTSELTEPDRLNHNKTALIAAASLGLIDLELTQEYSGKIVSFLLQSGADKSVKTVDDFGRQAIDYAVGEVFPTIMSYMSERERLKIRSALNCGTRNTLTPRSPF